MKKHDGDPVKFRVRVNDWWHRDTVQTLFKGSEDIDVATLGVGCDWLSQTVYHGDVVDLPGAPASVILWIDGVFFVGDVIGLDPITLYDRGEEVEIIGNIWQDEYPGKLWIQEYVEDLNK